uniref:Uncharacterized protein n=1 Tax=Arundo donax TaxID=35708 RepID=A0A0A8Y2V7_ARUDO
MMFVFRTNFGSSNFIRSRGQIKFPIFPKKKKMLDVAVFQVFTLRH